MSYSKISQNVNSLKGDMYIYHNLPSGGARRTLLMLLSKLKPSAYSLLTGIKVQPTNFIQYLYAATIKNYFTDSELVRRLSNEKRLIVFQSWLTNAPFILLLSESKKKYYICHEPLREYYDSKVISNKNVKDRIVDILRLPIKIIDYYITSKSEMCIISNSSYSRESILKAYGKDSTIVYPGYNENLFKPEKNIRKLNQVISVGSINKLKGYENIINAISKIKKNKPTLVIVGNGGTSNYINYLKNYASKQNVDIKIFSNISDKKLKYLYSRSKLFIYSPISEPFGIVVLEAMAMGLPLICYSKGGGYSEILTDKNGVLLENLDSDLWASSINSILNDKVKLSNTSTYNKNYALNYSSKRYVEKLLEIINQ